MSNVSLVCYADGNPPPSYMWLQKLTSGKNVMRGYTSELQIKSVHYKHMGKLFCQATNMINRVKKYAQSDAIHLIVTGPPLFENDQIPMEIVAKAGEEIQIKVPFCSNSLPKAKWNITSEKTSISPSSESQILLMFS